METRVLRKYLLSFLGAVALALSIGTAKPMMVTFDGNTGQLISSTIYTPAQVNDREASFISNITDVVNTSANKMILSNGSNGLIVLYLTW